MTAFNTFLESSPQVVSQLETGVDVEFDDDTDLGLEAISLDQLHASNFFGDVESKGDCILSTIKEMLGSSCPDDVRKSCLKVMELLDLCRLEMVHHILIQSKSHFTTDGWVQRSRKTQQSG